VEKKIFCPVCKKDQDYEIRKETETYPVKNEPVTIEANVTYCSVCGEKIWNQEIDDVNLKAAFRIYREKHGLLQPEEIKRIRDKYALSQVAFAQILGLGEKTIARYEAGSLQDSAPNNLILLAGYPDAFKILLKKNMEHISKTCHVPILITGKEFDADLLASEEWKAMEETMHLNAVPGLADSILAAEEEPKENRLNADTVDW